MPIFSRRGTIDFVFSSCEFTNDRTSSFLRTSGTIELVQEQQILQSLTKIGSDSVLLKVRKEGPEIKSPNIDTGLERKYISKHNKTFFFFCFFFRQNTQRAG